MADENITESEVWAELDTILSLQDRMPGDIDVSQIAERYGVSETTAYRKMELMAKNGDWKMIKVRDDSTRGSLRYVIRKTNAHPRS